MALRTISPALDADASDEAWKWLYEGRIETRRAEKPCLKPYQPYGSSWSLAGPADRPHYSLVARARGRRR
ncbi:hypothetical protein GCM10010524_05360 [Streptomyces mexicanus]